MLRDLRWTLVAFRFHRFAIVSQQNHFVLLHIVCPEFDQTDSSIGFCVCLGEKSLVPVVNSWLKLLTPEKCSTLSAVDKVSSVNLAPRIDSWLFVCSEKFAETKWPAKSLQPKNYTSFSHLDSRLNVYLHTHKHDDIILLTWVVLMLFVISLFLHCFHTTERTLFQLLFMCSESQIEKKIWTELNARQMKIHRRAKHRPRTSVSNSVNGRQETEAKSLNGKESSLGSLAVFTVAEVR